MQVFTSRNYSESIYFSLISHLKSRSDRVGDKPRGGYIMENVVSDVEVLAEGVEDAEMVNACCPGGTGDARK